MARKPLPRPRSGSRSAPSAYGRFRLTGPGAGSRYPDSVSHLRSVLVRAALLVALALAALLAPPAARAQDDPGFVPLTAGQRVYDETGTSLTPEQTADLERRLVALLPIGADVIVYVRALGADPEATRRQVEDLQQAWVRQTGANQDDAVAILINRNPTNPNSARAGIYVGSTLDDGNVPGDEQVAIVDDALIPPLRDGDVHGSLVAGLERLGESIQFGPPRSAFERWSGDAADSWLPWAAIGAALAGVAGALALFRGRHTTPRPDQPPTTTRPGTLTPAIAGALVNGGPQVSGIPATLLDLAGRGALTIEPESDGGPFSGPKIRLRLVDRRLVRGEVEAAVWTELEKLAEGEIVPSRQLTKLSGKTSPVFHAIRAEMRSNGWLNPAAGRPQAGIYTIAFAAIGLIFLVGIAASNGDNWWLAGAGMVALGVAAIVAFWLGVAYSSLTREGQEAAIPWKAYRDGLKRAGRDEAIGLDLDAVLPDVVALNLGSDLDRRLKAAGSSGQTLRAFSGATGTADGVTTAAFPFWLAFSSSTASTSAAGSSTVSSGGSGGGGGAAGST